MLCIMSLTYTCYAQHPSQIIYRDYVYRKGFIFVFDDSEGTAYRCFSSVGNISVNPDLRLKPYPMKAIFS